jgi:hypothetical protein
MKFSNTIHWYLQKTRDLPGVYHHQSLCNLALKSCFNKLALLKVRLIFSLFCIPTVLMAEANEEEVLKL